MNEQPSKIYLLPNLMTAGNLFCGIDRYVENSDRALLKAQTPLRLIASTRRSGLFSVRSSLIFWMDALHGWVDTRVRLVASSTRLRTLFHSGLLRR